MVLPAFQQSGVDVNHRCIYFVYPLKVSRVYILFTSKQALQAIVRNNSYLANVINVRLTEIIDNRGWRTCQVHFMLVPAMALLIEAQVSANSVDQNQTAPRAV